MDARRKLELQQDALTVGELGAVAAQTVMVAILPVMLARYTSSAFRIGLAIGGEGIFALLLPVWSGMLSDRIRRPPGARLNGRILVVGSAALLLSCSVAVAPYLSGYWPLAAAALVSFAALHAYLTPFWALTIDAVPDNRRGRIQGLRGVLRSFGLAYGLVGAGLLFGIWPSLPFVLAAALVLATTGITAWASASLKVDSRPAHGPLGHAWRALVRNRPALWLLGADAFWNASFDGLRPYFFLYARQVLGTTVAQTSIGLVLLVAGLAVGSWVIGRLGDRHDRMRLLQVSSVVLVLALASGFLVRHLGVALVVAAAAGLAASAIMTLPYPLYANLVGDRAAGENTGLYVVSVTIGRIGAPLLVGGAIDVARPWLPRTQGYPAMWLISAALAAGGLFCVSRSASALRRARRAQQEQATARPIRSAWSRSGRAPGSAR
jgi:MFS family permease